MLLLGMFIKNLEVVFFGEGAHIGLDCTLRAWSCFGCDLHSRYRIRNHFSFCGLCKKGQVSGASVVMIEPFPIIFVTDKKSVKYTVVLALMLMILVLIVYFLF
jgi:uncharacterized membrane protein